MVLFNIFSTDWILAQRKYSQKKQRFCQNGGGGVRPGMAAGGRGMGDGVVGESRGRVDGGGGWMAGAGYGAGAGGG